MRLLHKQATFLAYFCEKKKNLRFQKYPDTSGKGLRQLTEGIFPRNCTLNAIVGFCLDQF